MITQEEVAKKAGVSFITVSRVINNRGYVKKETREKVLQAISELNYYTNHIGQSLRGKYVNTIGIIVPEPTNIPLNGMEFYNSLLDGIGRSTTAHNYDIILSNCRQNDANVDYFRLYNHHKADGLILFYPDMRFLKIKEIIKRNIPCVIIGERHHNSEISFVDSDNYDGMYRIVKYLVSRGMKNIAYVKGKPYMLNTQDRFKGFLQAMDDEGIEVKGNLIFEGDYLSLSGSNAMRKIISGGKLPDALICSNDLMAIGALQEAKKSGIGIPNDISLFGFDDINIASLTDPPLSTIHQPLFDMGFTASEFLFNKIQSPESHSQTMIFNVELIIRKSA